MERNAVIVIGGSSGALEALRELLAVLPSGYSLPIAVVLHVRPDRRSLLAAVLGDACALPVCEVDDKQPLVAGTVHVGPPNYHLMIERGGTLSLSTDEPVNFSRPAIDVLFESAADAFGAAATAVLLSGASDDGVRGLQRIAACGGRVAVQDPDTAATATMPRAALARLTPDHVLAPSGLGALLVALAGEAA